MLESQLELEFSPDKSTAGYRLHELSLLNWGTFHNEVYSMRPDGRTSMVTGRNGSGKSTIVDALLTLLVPNRVRNYNAWLRAKRAAGKETSVIMFWEPIPKSMMRPPVKVARKPRANRVSPIPCCMRGFTTRLIRGRLRRPGALVFAERKG